MDEKKECECKGLELLLRMTNAYQTWLYNPATAEKAFAHVADDLLNHLQEEYKDPKYNPVRTNYDPIMDKLGQAVKDAWVGKTSSTLAVEILRNALHKQPIIRQMLTCGPPHSPETETSLTKDVFKSLELLENTEPADARKHMEGTSGDLTCEGG